MGMLVVVDGPNLFNDVCRCLAPSGTAPEAKALVLEYLRDYFDVDRLVDATLSTCGVGVDPQGDLGTVIFHSQKALGDDPIRIAGTKAITAFWNRQGSAPNTSSMLVDVPGAKQGKEVGVDTMLVVHLFETVDRWDTATVFTNDSDVVPAVWALRRKGKIVLTASPASEEPTPIAVAGKNIHALARPLPQGRLCVVPDASRKRRNRHLPEAVLAPLASDCNAHSPDNSADWLSTDNRQSCQSNAGCHSSKGLVRTPYNYRNV
jgi:hypothetical protein